MNQDTANNTNTISKYQRPSFGKKILNHFISFKNYYIVSSIVATILLSFCLIFNIFPFGSKTLASNDTIVQISPFLGLILDAIEGKSTLVFSNYISGGANIVGYLSYFVFSPFYIIILLFGKRNILYTINIVYIVQLICIAIVFLWFIRKYFKLSDIAQVIISLLYTFSPYIFLNYSWFSWLFLYTLLPIIVHFFLKMIKTKRILGFTLSVTAMIYNCYGVGLMGQILIFSMGTAFIFIMIKDKSKQKTCMINMLLAYGIAICLSMPFLAINVMQLLDSSRIGTSLEIFNKELFDNIGLCYSYIISDVISLIFGLTYMFKCDKKKKFNQFLIVALLLNAIPMLIDGIYLILSMGSYYGFGLRMSFLLSFFMVIALTCYIKDFYANYTQNLHQPNKGKRMLNLVLIISILVIIVYPIFIYVSDFLKFNINIYLFLGKYFIIPPTLLLTTLVLLNKKTKASISKKTFIVCLLIIAITQSYSNSLLTMGTYHWATDNITFLYEQAENLNIDYNSRLKDTNNAILSNGHLLTNFSQFSGFASQINEDFLNTTRALGYYTAGAYDSQVNENATYTYGGTILSDSFLAMDYVLYKKEIDFPWLQPISSKVFNEEDELYLYKNTLALNNAILVNKTASLDLSGNLLECTNSLYNYLGGEGDIMRAVALSDIVNGGDTTNICTLSQSNNEAVITFSNSAYNKVMYISSNPDKLQTINITNDFYDGFYLFNDTFVTIDYFEQNTQGSLIINDYKPSELDKIIIYELNYDMLVDLITLLQQQEVEFEFTASGFNAQANATNQKIVITNVNIDGYTATLNNKETDINDCDFIEINLLDGENYLEVSYHFPYTKTLIASSIFAIIGIVAILLIYKYLINFKKLQTFIYYCSIGLFVTFLAIVWFFPSVVFVVRLCLLKI